MSNKMGLFRHDFQWLYFDIDNMKFVCQRCHLSSSFIPSTIDALEEIVQFGREFVEIHSKCEAVICGLCNHSTEANQHGFDQNDAYMDGDKLIHSGRCTYCKGCHNPECCPLCWAIMDCLNKECSCHGSKESHS